MANSLTASSVCAACLLLCFACGDYADKEPADAAAGVADVSQAEDPGSAVEDDGAEDPGTVPDESEAADPGGEDATEDTALDAGVADEGTPDPGTPDPGLILDAPAAGDCPGFAEPPAGAAVVLYVSKEAGAGEPTGGCEAPFAGIGEALSRAPEGAVLLVAAGTYAEQLRIQRRVQLLGAGSEGEAATVIEAGDEPVAVRVEQASGALIRGVHVKEPSLCGVRVSGGSVSLEDVRVTAARADEEGRFGHGVVATGGARLFLRVSKVEGCEGAGVLLAGALGTATGSRIATNKAGGLRVEGSTALSESEAVRVEESSFFQNHGAGIAILSSRAEITGCTVSETRTRTSDDVVAPDLADGIVAGALTDERGDPMAGSWLKISGEGEDATRVSQSGRLGLFVAAGSEAVVEDASFTENGRGGIWVQGGSGADGAPVELRRNEVRQNLFTGIGISTGARAVVTENAIEDTEFGQILAGSWLVKVGDGVVLSSNAAATVTGNSIASNYRIGVLSDGALGGEATVIEGNTIRGNRRAIVLQTPHAESPVTVAEDANVLEDNRYGNEVKEIPINEEPEAIFIESRNGYKGGALPRTEVPD